MAQLKQVHLQLQQMPLLPLGVQRGLDEYIGQQKQELLEMSLSRKSQNGPVTLQDHGESDLANIMSPTVARQITISPPPPQPSQTPSDFYQFQAQNYRHD
jgi:hypothetical protein